MDFVFVVSSVRAKKPNCMFKCLQILFQLRRQYLPQAAAANEL